MTQEIQEIPKPLVLLVDDSHFIRKQLGKFLVKSYEVLTAGTGEEALEILASNPEIAVLLADIVMPGMGGLELLRRTSFLYPNIRVVMITSENTTDNILFALKNSAFSYIPKPIEKRTLLLILEAAINYRSGSLTIRGAHKDWIAIELPNDPNLIKAKLNFFYSLYNEFFSAEVAKQVGLAFEEMVFNAWEHGNKKNPDAKIFLEMIRFKKMIFYRIRDDGDGFNLAGAKHAAINNPEEDELAHLEARDEMGFRPGGLGILMTKNIVDEMKYSDRGNELILIKYFEEADITG